MTGSPALNAVFYHLQQGNAFAANSNWNSYYPQFVRYAHRRLKALDGEPVPGRQTILTGLKTFCEHAEVWKPPHEMLGGFLWPFLFCLAYYESAGTSAGKDRASINDERSAESVSKLTNEWNHERQLSEQRLLDVLSEKLGMLDPQFRLIATLNLTGSSVADIWPNTPFHSDVLVHLALSEIGHRWFAENRQIPISRVQVAYMASSRRPMDTHSLSGLLFQLFEAGEAAAGSLAPDRGELWQVLFSLHHRTPQAKRSSWLADELNQKLEQLDPELREYAFAKLYGSTNQEISEEFGVATNTVERKLMLIRRMWEEGPPEESS